MKYYLGIDPDLHNTAAASVDGKGEVVRLRTMNIPKKLTGSKAVEASLCEITNLLMHLIFDELPGIGDAAGAAIESQEIVYTARSGANPRDLVLLAQVAGGAYSSVWRECSPHQIHLPTPNEWKKGVPKHIHQARLCKRLGWEYAIGGSNEYAYPTNPPERFKNILKGQWKHLMDAIGLALWAREQDKG